MTYLHKFYGILYVIGFMVTFFMIIQQLIDHSDTTSTTALLSNIGLLLLILFQSFIHFKLSELKITKMSIIFIATTTSQFVLMLWGIYWMNTCNGLECIAAGLPFVGAMFVAMFNSVFGYITYRLSK